MPVLDWSRDVAQEMLPEFSDELEELVDSSFQSLVSLFDGAGHERFPTALSPDHIRALNRLGSGLRDGERIEFVDSKGSDGNVVYLDTVRRKALITRVRDTYEARYEDIGTLVGLHLDGYIDVQTALHGNLRLKVDPLRVSEEFDGNIESDVQFSVTIELDNYDKYRGVVEVYDVDLIEPELSENIMRCRGRLETLRHLKAGWHAGAGEPISQMAVDVAQRFLAKRPYFAGSYRLYPMLEGGILFEFEVMGWDLSIEFWAEGNAEFYGVEVSGSREIDPMTFADIDQLVLALDQYTRN